MGSGNASGSLTNVVDTGATTGTIAVNFNMFAIADRLQIYYGDVASNRANAVLLFDSGLVTNTGVTNLVYGPGPSTFVSMTVNEGAPVANSVFTITLDVQPSVSAAAQTTVIGGDFASAGGRADARLAFLEFSGTTDPLSGVGTLPRSVLALGIYTNTALPAQLGKVVVGGSFASIAGVSVNNVARLNTDGTVDLGFSPGAAANGPVNAVAVQLDGRVVLGGNFTAYDGWR